MKILVGENLKELNIIGANGIECTEDMLGNYNALNYDHDKESYTMSEEDFEWWSEMASRLEKIFECESELTEEQRFEYTRLDGCDLESWVEMAEEFLNNL